MCELVKIKTNFGEEVSIAEIKREHISNLIKHAENCKPIIEIILFGSSIEERCTSSSDIDIAIISNKTVTELDKTSSFKRFLFNVHSFDIAQEYDRLYFKSFDEIEKNKDNIPICKELIQKGKRIYRRS